MLFACDVVMAGTGLVHDVLLMQQREDMLEALTSNCEGWEHVVAIGESLQILSVMEKPSALKKAVGGSPEERVSPRRRERDYSFGKRSTERGERKRGRRGARTLTLARAMDIQRKMRSCSYRMGGANYSWLFSQIDKDHGGGVDVSELAHAIRQKVKVKDWEIISLFSKLDKNKDGHLSQEEVLSFLHADGVHEVSKALRIDKI